MNKSVSSLFPYFLLGCLLAVGCRIISATPLPTTTFVTATPTFAMPESPPTANIPPTPVPTAAVMPTPTLVPDTGWQVLQPNLERRVINLSDAAGEFLERLYILRVDPTSYQFGVAYDKKAKQLSDWLAETGAVVVINGGYFRQEGEDYIPTGLTIVDGEVIGSSYGAFAGMLAVTPNGPELRWLAQQPYNPDEPLLAGLQSFPILVKPGGVMGFPAENEDNKSARRTVIGQDRQGRILLMVASKGYPTLHQLSVYLADSDLDLDMAVNLDGGPSRGVLVANPPEGIAAFSALPIVITVHPR
jgi:uncharacterized protein YigE (DUF2233 family)